jgi:hypothetical protein
MPLPEAWSPQLPPLRDFVVSPGLAGTAVLVAAIVVFCAVLYASRRAARRLDKQLEQQDLHHQEARADRQRREAIDRCWERVVWLVETAGMEPAARDADDASLGLGPELALELLEGLHRDAKELGDDTLTRAVTVYLAQYGLVLGAQGGPLPQTLPESNGHQAQAADDKPRSTPTPAAKSSSTPTPADDDPPVTAEASTRKGRQR